jgi:predicted transcriptional regulator
MLTTYLNTLKTKGNFTYEAISNLSGIPEPTVRNIFSGKTEDPRFETVSSIITAMGGSLDEIYTKSKSDLKETSVLSIKEMYEFQIASMRETNEAHITNIRTHYEQHHQDLVDNFEKRLADKREIIEMQKKELASSKIVAWVCGAVLVALLIAEVMNPNLGWIKF